jgi:DNA-directed RNA polymerase subunit M/transcription elongation factor TFIIS
MQFFCTRCGERLKAPDDWCNIRVRCASCGGVTRTPDAVAAAALPVAEVAEEEDFGEFLEDEEPAAQPINDDDALRQLLRRHEAEIPFARVASLDYATPVEPPFALAVEELAERLANVQVAEDEPEASAMTDCPYCGSRIASFVGKCPFCRNPLCGR